MQRKRHFFFCGGTPEAFALASSFALAQGDGNGHGNGHGNKHSDDDDTAENTFSVSNV